MTYDEENEARLRVLRSQRQAVIDGIIASYRERFPEDEVVGRILTQVQSLAIMIITETVPGLAALHGAAVLGLLDALEELTPRTL